MATKLTHATAPRPVDSGHWAPDARTPEEYLDTTRTICVLTQIPNPADVLIEKWGTTVDRQVQKSEIASRPDLYATFFSPTWEQHAELVTQMVQRCAGPQALQHRVAPFNRWQDYLEECIQKEAASDAYILLVNDTAGWGGVGALFVLHSGAYWHGWRGGFIRHINRSSLVEPYEDILWPVNPEDTSSFLPAEDYHAYIAACVLARMGLPQPLWFAPGETGDALATRLLQSAEAGAFGPWHPDDHAAVRAMVARAEQDA